MTTCDKCGAEYEAPAWPWCPHGQVTSKSGEVPEYYDHGLDAVISTRGQRKVLERQLGVFPRDPISPGRTSERRDRIEADKRERRREGPSGKIYSR